MKVIKAIEFASKKHKGQVRENTGIPYITHPVIVMELIMKYKGDSKHIEELKCSALLHDTLEDTECTYVELERNFGPMVASIVMELTNDDDMIKSIGKLEYHKVKLVNMSNYAFIIKLVDRLANMMDKPRINSVKNTLKLMSYLKDNRDITDRQWAIIEEIERVCDKIIRKEKKCN